MIADPTMVDKAQLARINTGTTVGEFRDSVSGYTLTVSPRIDKKAAYYAIRLTKKKAVTSAVTNVTSEATAYVNIGFNVPNSGFSADEISQIFAAVAGWLTADTNKNMLRVLNGES